MNRRMKQLLLLLSIPFTASQVMAQKVYQIRADSVRIYSGCDTAELIIENRTKDTLGFLYNKGEGRTEFRKLQLQTVGNNAIAITGQDTLQLGTIIKTTVDTLYTSGTNLYYRKTDGQVVTVPLNLDGRYDLLSTNMVTVPDNGSIPFASYPANKVVGYYAYTGADMPTLSDQAFKSVGQKNYYDGLMFKYGKTGFDMAVNWDGEKQGPNGAFLRIKDDTDTSVGWSAWRELLFKDYADKKYAPRGSTGWTNIMGPGWYRIAINGSATTGAVDGNRAYAHFIITDGTASFHQTVEFIVTVLYNRAPTIQIISNGVFGTQPFAAIRVVKGNTYEGTAIDILTYRPEQLSIKASMVDNEQTGGWSMVNWQKITSNTDPNEGVPSGMTQMSFVLSPDVIEGTADQNGVYWLFNRNTGLSTNAGYRTRGPLSLVGDYKVNSTNKKVIWTMGEDNVGTDNFYGIGYDFGNQVTPSNADHQIVFAKNGLITHRFNLGGGVLLNGNVKTNGAMSAIGFQTTGTLAMVGDFSITGLAKKIIWTKGDQFVSDSNYYGIGYDIGNQIIPSISDEQIVIASKGVVAHRFNMKGGVLLGGDVRTTGNITAAGNMTSTGFYQSSLRSLKKDITLFNGDALKLIKGLKITEFSYKDDKEENRHVGIIADDSDWHFSTKNHDKFDSNSAIAITMKAVQELTDKLEALNKRLDELESAVNKAHGNK